MSKYTTEVRYICEQAAGRTESGEYPDIDTIIEQAYPKIFDVDNIPVYVQEHKPLLLKKILLHYYQREIGFETVGLWKYYINTKLKEIMPYYNQLYASELLEYDPLQNVNNTHTHTGLYEDTSKVDNRKKYDNQTDTTDSNIGTKNTNRNETETNTYDHDEDVLLKHSKETTRGDDTITNEGLTAKDQWTLYSDTPQGGINGVQLAGGSSASGTLSDNAYLTNATHVTDKAGKSQQTNEYGKVTETYNPNSNNKDHTDVSGTATNTDVVGENQNTSNIEEGKKVDDALTVEDNLKKDNGSDSYENREFGKIGVMTYQDMVLKYRETFLNIDMMIINELSDLFMKVW